LLPGRPEEYCILKCRCPVCDGTGEYLTGGIPAGSLYWRHQCTVCAGTGQAELLLGPRMGRAEGSTIGEVMFHTLDDWRE
jgi:hypothetical protein